MRWRASAIAIEGPPFAGALEAAEALDEPLRGSRLADSNSMLGTDRRGLPLTCPGTFVDNARPGRILHDDPPCRNSNALALNGVLSGVRGVGACVGRRSSEASGLNVPPEIASSSLIEKGVTVLARMYCLLWSKIGVVDLGSRERERVTRGHTHQRVSETGYGSYGYCSGRKGKGKEARGRSKGPHTTRLT